jgi:hypothetical protein
VFMVATTVSTSCLVIVLRSTSIIRKSTGI